MFRNTIKKKKEFSIIDYVFSSFFSIMINLAYLAIFSLLCLYLSVINRSINASEKLGFRRWGVFFCVGRGRVQIKQYIRFTLAHSLKYSALNAK